jgi:UDP-N-acetylglucosamine--N-acetylmuramyl-(pentapeptide) pyrophosphoryl-undecaprenol N-acetylglucosamine transferase
VSGESNHNTLIVAGGGTGGHVLAGIAVADAWKQRFGASARVVFVGAMGGIEEKLVPRAGYPLETLKLGSLNRVGWSRRIRTLFQIPAAMVRSLSILLNERPKLVLGVGGYASGPFVLTAALMRWKWGGKTAILEQNSVPGLTNRWLGRVVQCVFINFESVSKYFPDTPHVMTGNPIRSEFAPLPSARTQPFQIFIFGGSQGAAGLNAMVIDALPHLKSRASELRWVHQTGERDFEKVTRAYAEHGVEARIERFIFDMKDVYAASSLVICRAGASTLAELATVKRAAILVPLPTAADDHQTQNARAFVERGAAILATQTQTNGEQLAKMILDLVAHPEKISAMEDRVHQFYRPHAAKEIVSHAG